MLICFKALELVSLFLLSKAVDPGCECLRYSGTYGKDFGKFNSPDFPKPYPSNINCLLYTFIGGSHEIISLEFTHFDVHKANQDCSSGDFVKVFLNLTRPEVNEFTPWSGLLCGRRLQNLYSSGPALVLQFHTNNNLSNSTGFSGIFKFIDKSKYKNEGHKLVGTECDYIFMSNNSTQRGKFYSPYYPSSYQKNSRCTYRFRGSCLEHKDFIKVYDGSNKKSSVLAILCNERTNVEITSSSNSLTFELVSGPNWSGQGFSGFYSFEEIKTFTTVSSTEESMKLTTNEDLNSTIIKKITDKVQLCTKVRNCDLTISSDNHKGGIIDSPNYPNLYLPNTHCKYHFRGSGRERIVIIFKDLSLSNQFYLTDCDSGNNLMIHMQIDGKLKETHTLCGNEIPETIMSNGLELLIEFIGRYPTLMSRGFSLEYSFVEDFGIKTGIQVNIYPCAFNYTGNFNGTISSPNFPARYPKDTECHYLFHIEQSQILIINFTTFDINATMPCDKGDFLQVSTNQSTTLYCGKLDSFVVKLDQQFARLTFKSDNELEGYGFNASYVFMSKPYMNNRARKPVYFSFCLFLYLMRINTFFN